MKGGVQRAGDMTRELPADGSTEWNIQDWTSVSKT